MAESSEEFGARIGNLVSTAFVSFGVSLGHEVGLFDVLAENEEPRTSEEIADAANLKERYVRELLSALVMGKIVELDESGEKYYLPRHRATFLARGEACNNGHVNFLTFLPTLGGDVYKQLKECLKKDGPRGVPYDAYGDTMDRANKWTGKFLSTRLVAVCVTPYPELRNKLESGITVLDIGCGQGVSTVTLAEAFPNSTFCGVDFQERSLKAARELAEGRNIKNTSFVAQDAANMPADWSSKYDFVFMHDTLHDQARPDKVLSETYRVLTPGGVCMISDIMSHSKLKDNLEKRDAAGCATLYTVSLLHCMPVSLYFDGGMGLGTCWGREKAVEMITAAGFEVISIEEIPEAAGIKYYCKKA